MPYGERMLFLIGAGVMLIGAGWFFLVRWPSIEEAATTPALVRAGDVAAPVEDALPGLVDQSLAEPDPAPPTEEPVSIEGSLDTIQEQVVSVPESAATEDAPHPEPVAQEQKPLAPEVEAVVVEEERRSEAVVEYPLPAESIRPAESERDAPIQMVITRDRPISESDESAEIPQEDGSVSE